MGNKYEYYTKANFVSGARTTEIFPDIAYYVAKKERKLELSVFLQHGIIGTLTLFNAEQVHGMQKPLFYQAFEPAGFPNHLIRYGIEGLLVSQAYFDFGTRIVLRNRKNRGDELEFRVFKG